MITAYEHHMKMDFSEYPKVMRPRKISVFSKIVGLAAAFDAATSTHSYAARKVPDVALRELREDPDGSFVRSVIRVTEPDKYLINVSDYFS
jgi:HD-GYP domain-containing protein (c-di-GMP phosphodiesterase class II)